MKPSKLQLIRGTLSFMWIVRLVVVTGGATAVGTETLERSQGRKSTVVSKINIAEFRRMEWESPIFKRNGLYEPNNEVTYDLDTHPLSKSRRLNEDYVDPRSFSKPIRITFVTQALESIATDAQSAAKVDWIKSEILPRVQSLLRDSLRVAPVVGRLKVPSTYLYEGTVCGGFVDPDLPRVPYNHITKGLDNTDLVIYVSGIDCIEGVEAYGKFIHESADSFPRNVRW